MVRLSDRPDMTLDVYRGRKKINKINSNVVSAAVCRHFDLMCPLR